MAEEKTMSTCLRLPLDVREKAEALGGGNITEGISLGVRFAAAMRPYPGVPNVPLMIRTVIELTELLSTAILVNQDQERRIAALEASLDLVQSADPAIK